MLSVILMNLSMYFAVVVTLCFVNNAWKPHLYHPEKIHETQWLKVVNKCERKAEQDDTPLCQVFDNVSEAVELVSALKAQYASSAVAITALTRTVAWSFCGGQRRHQSLRCVASC